MLICFGMYKKSKTKPISIGAPLNLADIFQSPTAVVQRPSEARICEFYIVISDKCKSSPCNQVKVSDLSTRNAVLLAF